MSSSQNIHTVNDPTHDPRVKKIELVYKKFLDTLEGLSREQQQVITDALSELNHRQIEAVRTQLHNQQTNGKSH